MTTQKTLWMGLLMTSLYCVFPSDLYAESVQPATNSLVPEVHEKCLSILRRGLKSDEFWPSMHAAEALTQAGHGQEVLQALEGRLAKEQDLRKRCGLAREQVRAGDATKVAELKAVLANPDPYGHVHACESLYKVGQAGDLKLLQIAMNDSSNPVKALMAAAALVRQGDAAALKMIRQELTKQDPQNSWVAGWLLGTLGDQSDLPAMRQGLKLADTDRNRAYFQNALGRLGDQDGVKAMLGNLQNTDAVVRADAAYMVGEAGIATSESRLIELLNDENLDVTIRAAQGLLALNQPDKETVTIAAQKPADAAPIPPEVVLSLRPGHENSRNSEGDFVHTKDGRILFIYSYFGKGTGDDYDTAELRERVSTDGGKTWSKEERTIVRPESGLNVMSVSLLRLANGDIALFYCAKVSHSDCRPEMRISKDEGKTWGSAVKCVTDEVDYYVLNNSRVVQLKSGRIVLPLCLHKTLDTKKNDWAGQLLCYYSDDNGQTWKRSKSVLTGKDTSGKRVTVQEPGVVELNDGRVMMFIRSSAGCQMISYSKDGCDTWSEPEMSDIKSPLSPASIKRIPSTGDLLLVWNDHSAITPELKGRRTPLSVAVSKDDGKTWGLAKKLFDDPNGWYCYIAIDFSGDDVLLGHCAGDRRKNGLTITDITRFNLAWLYGN